MEEAGLWRLHALGIYELEEVLDHSKIPRCYLRFKLVKDVFHGFFVVQVSDEVWIQSPFRLDEIPHHTRDDSHPEGVLEAEHDLGIIQAVLDYLFFVHQNTRAAYAKDLKQRLSIGLLDLFDLGILIAFRYLLDEDGGHVVVVYVKLQMSHIHSLRDGLIVVLILCTEVGDLVEEQIVLWVPHHVRHGHRVEEGIDLVLTEQLAIWLPPLPDVLE